MNKLTQEQIAALLPGRTPLARLYLQHTAAIALAFDKGDPDGGCERSLMHMGICDGIVATAQTLFDAESFEAFKRDTGLDVDTSRAAAHLKNAFTELPF